MFRRVTVQTSTKEILVVESNSTNTIELSNNHIVRINLMGKLPNTDEYGRFFLSR